MDSRRLAAFGLLVASNLLWSGNWVIGRAVRDVFDPLALNWWRWLVAALVMAPFGMREAMRHADNIRRHAGLFLLLALTGVVGFQSLVYLGLRTTTAINAVLINAAGPLFMLICSWLLERDRPSRRQIAGMLISFLGVLIVVSRGHLQDAPAARIPSRRRLDTGRHADVGPVFGAAEARSGRAARCGVRIHDCGDRRGNAAAALPDRNMGRAAPADATGGRRRRHIAVAASVLAFIAGNRGVTVVGANAAGFTLPLLPAFGTALAIVFLGEVFQAFNAVGFFTIVIGVVLATYRRA